MKAEKVESHATEVSGFLSALYYNQEGYVYAPTKNLETEYWQPYFFKWPDHKNAIITHLLDASREKDVYVAPSLFKAHSDKKTAWKGSNYVWVEFDGNAPEVTPTGIPMPSIRIQSSVKGHEHWYWRLNDFERDYHTLEGLAKSLTYTLDADKSGWDCSQVLRPPGTIHQESKKRVRILTQSDRAYDYNNFKNLVTAPEPVIAETTIDKLPDIQEVVAKYKWDADAVDLFHKPTQPVGVRSSAMTRLGFHCIEMGMSNDECYVVLYNADERWGKYKHRNPSDRAKRLIGIISHCRGKKELDAELNLSQRESFITLGDFFNTEFKLKWLYTNFLAEQGLGVISSAPGIGKSTLSIRLGLSVVLAQDFLIWKYAMESGKKVGFLSLEMGHRECRIFLETMWPSFSPDEQELLSKNFFILPQGYNMPLSLKPEQQIVLDAIDAHNIDFLIIDSLKAATGLDEKRTDTFFDWINKHVRDQRGCTVWIVHHNRKASKEDTGKSMGVEDLYGDTFITTYPSTIIGLKKLSKNKIRVIPLKNRLAIEADPFTVVRSEKDLSFQLYTGSDAPVEEKKEVKHDPFK